MDFRGMFIKNSSDYTGAHGTQGALLDQMVTTYMDGFDREREVTIAQASTGLPPGEIEWVVDLVRAFRDTDDTELKRHISSVWSCIRIARILQLRARPKAYCRP